jgi:peptidoglycan endopeptidase LytE
MKESGVLPRRFSILCFFFFFLFFIPPANSEMTHIIKPGESLYSIAKKYHLSTEQLREANELSSDKIRAGETLVIPEHLSQAESMSVGRKKLESEATESEDWEIPETHAVKKGETLAGIARRYNLRVKDLQEVNQLKGPRLRAGQILHLTERDADQGEFEAGRGESEEGKTEARVEEYKFHVRGNGFLIGEKDRQLLVRVAKGFLGLRYSRGGSSVNGMDCSAFVRKVFSIFAIDLPRTAREQFQIGYGVAREALEIGDLVFFKRSKVRRPTHVGIYIGDGQFIHTSLRKRRVEIDNLESRYFSTRFIGAKRIEEAKESLENEGSIRSSVPPPQE